MTEHPNKPMGHWTFKAVMGLLFASVLVCASSTWAQEKKSDEPSKSQEKSQMAKPEAGTPQALQAAAAQLRHHERILNAEVDHFLGKLQSDPAFAKQFHNAVREKNNTEVLRLLKEGGITQGEAKILETQEDVRITIEVCFWRICIRVTIEW
jgi:hypothetical protein